MRNLRFTKTPKIDITYLGGLGENLTGSSKLITISLSGKIHKILVDAGARQGGLDQDSFNTTIPVDLQSINAIILTHAHMDHIGKILRYVRNGYNGTIHTTHLTKPLLFEALKDEQKICLRILEEKKEILTRIKKAYNIVKRYESKNTQGGVKTKKIGPQKTEEIKNKYIKSNATLNKNGIINTEDIKKQEYIIQHMEDEIAQNEQDLRQVLSLIKTHPYNRPISIIPKLAQATFYNAGHIEGSAQVDIEIHNKNMLFSGDLGRIHDNTIVGKPTIPTQKKYSFVSLESTYAGKIHPEKTDAKETLFTEIADTHGPILMPCFSLQRIPEIVHTLLQSQDVLAESEESIYGKRAKKEKSDDIENSKKEPRKIDIIYIDSPLGKKYKEIFMKELGTKYKYLNTSRVKFISAADREDLLGKIKKGYRILIISSSGMLQGGTVMHYLQEVLKQRKAKIIFTGFPGKNTLASQIVDGNKKVSLQGTIHEVECQSKYVEGFSSHADHDELVAYYKAIPKIKNVQTALEHGGISREILAADIKKHGATIIVPQEGDTLKIL